MLTARRRGCQHCAPPLACRERGIAVMPRDRGASRLRRGAPNVGGFGGADAAVREVSRSCPEIEARHGCAGARRTVGGVGAMSGPPWSFDRAACEAGDAAGVEEMVAAA